MMHSTAKKNIGNAADAFAETISENVSDYAKTASDKVGEAAAGADTAAKDAIDAGRDASARLREVGGNFKSAADNSLRDQPMTTLAVAATMGFVLGALWKS